MDLALPSIALDIAKAVFPSVGKAIVSKINSELNPTDLEKALKTGIKIADEYDTNQPDDQQLFYHWEPKLARELLERFFKDTSVQEELQKPLIEKTTPELTYLIAQFKNLASEHPDLKFPGNSIETWLKKFTDTYFEKTSTYLRFQLAKQDYLTQIADWFDDVKFAGIAVEGQEIDKSATLANIFVMPNVAEDIQSREFPSFSPNSSNLQAELFSKKSQMSRLSEHTGRKFSAEKLLTESTSKKFVILGEPGSGKTTLLSYFAVMLALKQYEKLGLAADTECLPILLKIRDLIRYPDLCILEYLEQFSRSNLQVKQLPTGFFEYWLEDGRALILLDGLDEVVDAAKRDDLVRKIECFLGQFPENQAIITSRPAGYRRDFFRTEEFPHYTLQLFDKNQVEQFVKYWYASRFKDQNEAQRRGESLQKALAEQEKIKVLARNPLLLTIIALIHRYEAHLPRQRYKLYERAVQTLLTAWDAGKDIDYKWPLEYLNRDDIKRLMERLAYWIHSQGGTGEKEGGTLIDKDELLTQLGKFIAEQKHIERHQAKAEAQRFVDYVRERCGLLNEQGQDCYAFVHKTFQEYLAAEEIRYRQEDEDFDVVVEHIQKYLHDAHWREVLLLLFAQQKPKKATKFLEEILRQDTAYEQWLYRNLFLAGKCLAEDIEISDKGLVADILQRLIALEIGDSNRLGERIKSQVFKILCSLYETRFEAQALQLLKNSADGMGKVRLLQYCVVLGKKDEGIPALLAQLKDDDSEVRYVAAWSLGALSNTSDQVISALLVLLQDEDSLVRSYAALALGRLGNSSEVIIHALLARLEDEDFWVRSDAAIVLGMLGNSSDLVIHALLARLDDENSQVRIVTAVALRDLGNSSDLVIHALLAKLEDEDSQVRTSAAVALGMLSSSSDLVISTLLALLKDEDSGVRSNAALALGDLGNSSDIVIQALLTQLKDEDSEVRAYAAETLVKLGKPSAEIIPIVVEWISQHKDSEDVGDEIDALWDLVAGEN